MSGNELSVRLLARPAIDWENLLNWVSDQGGDAWSDRIAGQYTGEVEESAEFLVEAAGRRCYKSWAPGLNPNVTRVREDSDAYLQNIVNVGHGSVLEHAQYSFAIENVDRVVTHELVRHRVGTAISQESLRYVRLVDIPFRHPAWVEKDDTLREMAHELIEQMEAFQVVAARVAGIDRDDVNFHIKKEVTSDLRRYAPQGTLTGLVWSANLRTLRTVIEARTDPSAEREIRELFHKIGLIMVEEAPAVFADFLASPVPGSSIPQWVAGRSKV